MNFDRCPSPQTRFGRPAGWMWSTFQNASGARLRYGYSELAGGNRARIILLTGFREFGEKYFETVRDLLALEYAVWQLDWYGQGGSDRHYENRQKIGSASVDCAVADLHTFVTTVLPDDPETPLVIVSHSTGGLILLRYLHDHPDAVAAAVMSAPLFALHTGRFPTGLARGLARFAVTTGFGSSYIPGGGDWRLNTQGGGENSRTSHDPERGSLQGLWMQAYPELRMGGATFGWLDTVFRLTAESARASYLQAVSTPILIGSAGKDTLVLSKAHDHAVGLLPNAQLVALPDAKHELFMETDAARDRWLTEIDRFLDAWISGRSGEGSCR